MPSTLTSSARSPVKPIPLRGNRARGSGQLQLLDRGCTDAIAMVETCFCASSRARNVTASSGNEIVPSSAARSAFVADRSAWSVTTPLSVCGAPEALRGQAHGGLERTPTCAESRRAAAGRLERMRRMLERCGAPVAGQVLDRRFAVRRLSPAADVRKAGLEVARENQPFLTVSARSGSSAFNVPLSVPVIVSSPSPATACRAEGACVSVARLPLRSSKLALAGAIGQRQLALDGELEPLASTSRLSIVKRSLAYCNAPGS